MDVAVTTLVLCAALLHAGWNVAVKAGADPLLTLALIMAFAGLAVLPAVPFLPFPQAASHPYLAVSLALHVGYSLFLLLAYRVGDLSAVYPLARGSAPLLVGGFSLLFTGEVLKGLQGWGVLLISLGIVSLAFHRGMPGRREGAPILFALGTGVFIASYTVVDATGVRLAGNPHSYTAWLFLLHALPLLAIAFALRGRRVWGYLGRHWKPGLVGGIFSLLAYGIVLWALSIAPMASVAALRETSVIFAAVIGALFLQEPFGRLRIGAAVLIAVGIVLLNTGGDAWRQMAVRDAPARAVLNLAPNRGMVRLAGTVVEGAGG